MSRVSVCVSQIAAANIHPVLYISKPHTSSHLTQETLQGLTVWSQISSNFLTRCFTTCRRWGFTAPFQLTAPLGAFPNESQTAAQLDYLADWPAVPPATSVWSQHTLATQPHPGNKSLWTSLECLLSFQVIVCKSKQGPNLISAQHISALSEIELRQK